MPDNHAMKVDFLPWTNISYSINDKKQSLSRLNFSNVLYITVNMYIKVANRIDILTHILRKLLLLLIYNPPKKMVYSFQIGEIKKAFTVGTVMTLC